MSDVTLTTRQRQTLPGRQALAAKFPTPEAKSQHYRQIGERGNAGRVVLRADEAQAVASAYALLGQIVAKLPPEHKVSPLGSSPSGDEGGR